MVEESAPRARNRLSSSDEWGAPFHFETAETPITEFWSAQLNKVKAISESHRNTKAARSKQDRTSGKLTPRETAGIRRRAQSTTWWIYREIGDPDACKLLQKTFKKGLTKNLVAQRLGRAIPGWIRRDETRRELSQLLAGQFQLLTDVRQSVIDEIKSRVNEHCIDFAIRKYGDRQRTKLFGRRLGNVAFSQLGIRELAQARAAQAILQGRTRRINKTRSKLKQLTGLLKELGVSPKLRVAAIAEARSAVTQRDPIQEVLKRFFKVKDRFGEPYWKRFFDRHGKPRTKKLPGFPEMRKQLVEHLLSPEQRRFTSYPAGCEVNRKEAWALTASCLKVAFPTFFSSTLSGESVKHALRYERHREELMAAKIEAGRNPRSNA